MISERNIPPTYDLIKKGKTTIVVKDAYRKTFIKMGINEPERFLSRFTENSDCYQGRGALKTMTFPENEKEQMIIRHYRRGGRMQKFTADIYWGASRPLRELWVGYQAMDKGLPTAEIIAACHTQVFWLFHRGDLISREIKNGIDLIRYLQGLLQPLTKEKILQKRKVIQSVGKIIRKMHEVGISHGDLHLKNILLQINDPQEINIYIIDFDKSSATSQLNENKRIQNLLRLNRSVEKYKKMGLPITRTDVLRFLLAYYQNPPNFRTLIRELTQRYKRHMRYHRLGEKILKLF